MKAELSGNLTLLTEERPEIERWIACFGSFEGSRVLRLFNSKKSSPDCASHQNCSVIFDGVLYNQKAIQNESSLNRDEKPAKTILNAYLQWGESSIEKFEGIYTLIIWDRSRDILLCLRDRVGVYPLFYSDAGKDLLISTSINALARQPGVNAKVDRAVIADHIRHRYPKLNETFLTNINRVPPGNVMKVVHNGRNIYRYWNPLPIGAPVKWADEDELETFDQLFENAVSRFLSLGPAAIFLSGGLDSVSVAAVAAERSRRDGLPDPLALSIIFPHPDCNEESVQRPVAAALGIPQVILPYDETVGPAGTLQASIELCRSWPAPPVGYNLAPYHFLALEGKRRGHSVILTGGGGDEWLTVSPSYAGDLLRNFDLLGFYRFVRQIKSSWPVSNKRLAQNVWRFAVRPMLASPVRRFLSQVAPNKLKARQLRFILEATPPWLAPDPALRKELRERAEKSLGCVPGRDGLYMFDARLSLDHPLVSMEMEDYFETNHRLGVRWLQPFWDARICDLLFRSRPELLFKDGRSKGLVRQSIHRRFPKLGFDRQKKVRGRGFFSGMLMKEGPDTWKRLGGAQTLVDMGIVDAKQVNAKMDFLFENPQTREIYRIWELINLEAWVRPRV